jgi:hypothetical protein
MLENINFKIEGLTFSVQNQLSFHKMIEKQIAQLAAVLPISDSEKIPRNPKLLSSLLTWSQRGLVGLYVGKTIIIL